MRTRPLTEVAAREIRPLLDEESEHWRDELLWDYADVSAAVASGLERSALRGVVLEDAGRPVAYCYYLMDGGRAIVGSSFASTAARGKGVEEEMLDTVLADAQQRPGNERIECQTLFCTGQEPDRRFARAGFRSRPRHYLIRALAGPLPAAPTSVLLRPVRREDLPLAAQIIHRSHVGSLDAALNLTYTTSTLCRGFVETLVLRAGCGRFAPEASFVAETREGPVGVLLASRLSRQNGHICQVSVAPEAHGSGVGRTLMVAALSAFREAGLSHASLSVTVGNGRAYRLYEKLGFRVRREFAAHAWLRPPGRIELPA